MSELTAPVALLRAAPAAPGQGLDPDRARHVAREFEASFLSAMLQPMFASLSTEAPFGGGAGEATWRSFLVDAMARQAVNNGGVGVSDAIQRELIALQAGRPDLTAPEETA